MCTTHCKMLAFLLYLLGFTVQLTVALKQWPGQNCSEMAFGDGQYLRVCGKLIPQIILLWTVVAKKDLKILI